nr:MAG TPA: hypothetical protein [Caudoviricetes sp.]
MGPMLHLHLPYNWGLRLSYQTHTHLNRYLS